MSSRVDAGPRIHGYVTDATYADSYFRELSPAWLNWVAAVRGGTPRPIDQPFTYLELGCGLGTSAVVHAGAFPHAEFHACDVNPAHVDAGRRHAAALDITNIHFHQQSFEEVRGSDLPAFDFIVLHGVYSWVEAAARQHVRRIVRETLKSGGLVYVSYNCLPGWASEAPLRKLLVELAVAGRGTSAERSDDAARELRKLAESRLRYFNANPTAVTAVESYAKRPGTYLAHEFLNDAWEPFYSVDVADEMLDAGVEYLGSATLAENFPQLVLDARAADSIAGLATPRLRALAVDFAVNQRFRRDVFVKGPALDSREPPNEPFGQPVGCLDDPEKIGTRARVPRGEITFQDDFIRDLRRLMQEGPMAVGEIVGELEGPGRRADEIARNVGFLVAAGALVPFASARNRGAGSRESARGSSASEREAALSQPGVGPRQRVRQDGSGGGAPRPVMNEASPPRLRAANIKVERVLAEAVERQERRYIPCEMLGGGVPIEPDVARAVLEIVAETDELDGLAARNQDAGAAREADEYYRRVVPSFMRLGLLLETREAV